MFIDCILGFRLYIMTYRYATATASAICLRTAPKWLKLSLQIIIILRKQKFLL